jgi:hypothetical protein
VLPVSERFLLALRDAHAISVACNLFPPGSATPISVDVVNGEVNANAAARVLRQGSVEVAFAREDTATASLLQSLPFGGYCALERGIEFADGTVERVPLGMFRVDSVVWGELTGSATLNLSDRFAQIQDEPLALPFNTRGKHPTDAIVTLVQAVFGSAIAYHVETTPSLEPLMAGTIYDQEREAAISDLQQAVSAETLFDVHGDFVVRPTYKPHAPVWVIDTGERGVLVSAETTLDRSSVRNGVSVRGQPDSELPPIYGLATYTNPASPLRWGGPFGRVVMIAESTAVSTQAQADATARSLLNLRLSMSRTFAVSSVPNPALEPEDVVTIIFPDGHSEDQAIKETHIGLGPEGTLGLVTVDKYAGDFAPTALPLLYGEEAARELALALVGDE